MPMETEATHPLKKIINGWVWGFGICICLSFTAGVYVDELIRKNQGKTLVDSGLLDKYSKLVNERDDLNSKLLDLDTQKFSSGGSVTKLTAENKALQNTVLEMEQKQLKLLAVVEELEQLKIVNKRFISDIEDLKLENESLSNNLTLARKTQSKKQDNIEKIKETSSAFEFTFEGCSKTANITACRIVISNIGDDDTFLLKKETKAINDTGGNFFIDSAKIANMPIDVENMGRKKLLVTNGIPVVAILNFKGLGDSKISAIDVLGHRGQYSGRMNQIKVEFRGI
jgi:hypothetical protein